MPDQTASAHHLEKSAVRADDVRRAASRVATGRGRRRAVDLQPLASTSSSEAAPEGVPVRPAEEAAGAHLAEHSHSQPTRAVQREHVGDAIYLTLGMPLSVMRMKAPASAGSTSGEDLCAEWDRLSWKRYEFIADGLRKIVTLYLDLSCDEICVDKSVHLVDAIAVPRMIVRLKEGHNGKLKDPRFYAAIESYLRLIKGQAVSGVSVQDSYSGQQDLVDDIAATPADAASPLERVSIRQILDIARDVAGIVGGHTLPARCRVDSPAWEQSGNDLKGFELSGPLVKAPERAIEESKPILKKCTIDGFKGSAHIVYLVFVDSKNAKTVSVGFDEESYLAKIRYYASLPKKVFDVQLVLSGNEANPRRTLRHIAPVQDEDFALN